MTKQRKQKINKEDIFFIIVAGLVNIGVFFFVAMALIIFTEDYVRRLIEFPFPFKLFYVFGCIGILYKCSTINWMDTK